MVAAPAARVAAKQVPCAIEADSVAPIRNGISFGGSGGISQPRLRKAPATGKAGTLVIDAGPGGSTTGKGPLANASTTLIDELSKLYVSATDAGNGGKVEVSGKAHLALSGTVNTLAPKGKTGNLLLDLSDVTISTGTDTNQSGFTATGTGSIINTTTLQTALATSNVTKTKCTITLCQNTNAAILTFTETDHANDNANPNINANTQSCITAAQ